MRIFILIACYDLWCLIQVRRLIRWLSDWGISQRTLERSLIVLYLFYIDLPAPHTVKGAVMLGVADGLLLFPLWSLHRKPEAEREEFPPSPVHCGLRGIIQIAIWVPALLITAAPPHHWTAPSILVATFIFVVFYYSTETYINGQRGRRRKLALEQLKKLFGELEWLPKPAFEGE